MANNLPHVRQSIVGGDGIATQPWYAWFGRIQAALNAGTISDDEASAAISALATALGSPDGTVANIPPLNFLPKTTYARGSSTIAASGTLAGGGVEFALPALTDTAAGTFKLLTRDAYGRVEGTADGDAADVPYDNAGSGLAATDVQAAIDEVAAAGGGGAMSLLGTATVAGAAATTLTLSGLNLAAYKYFFVLIQLNNATASNANISLYFNADTTATNYYRQLFNAISTTLSGGAANTSVFTTLFASETSTGEMKIANDKDGKPRSWGFLSNNSVPAVAISQFSTGWNSATNVTGITLSSSVANALAIGSAFTVYGVS